MKAAGVANFRRFFTKFTAALGNFFILALAAFRKYSMTALLTFGKIRRILKIFP
jgi:hypothetical protein